MSKKVWFCWFLLFSTAVFAQKEEVPVGHWRIHLPYNAVNSIAESPSYLYVGAERGFYSFHKKSGEMQLYGKTNGFSDVEVQLLKYHEGLNILLVAYKNTNIDILQGSSIYNISDILRKSIIGTKEINDIHFEGNLAYLSCSFGIVVIDLEKKAIKDTYLNIGLNGIPTSIFSVAFFNDSIFAGTEYGIIKAAANGSNLSDFNSWEGPIEMINNGKAHLMRKFGGKIYCDVGKFVRVYDGSRWMFKGDTIPTYRPITQSIEVCHNQLVIAQIPDSFVGGITIVQPNGTERVVKEVTFNFAILDHENSLWFGNDFSGLVRRDINGNYSYTQPNGPQRASSFSMTTIGDELWVAGGGISAQGSPVFNKAGWYRFENGLWKSRPNIPALLGSYDYVTIASNKAGNEVFMGCHGFGLVHLYNDSLKNIYTEQNSPIRANKGEYNIVDGLAMDEADNLWITNYQTDSSLLMRSNKGIWIKYKIPSNSSGKIIIDDFGRKWIVTGDLSAGMVVFEEGETNQPNDFRTLSLRNIEGQGSLPSNKVNAIVKDKDGEIWIGTDEGLAVFYVSGDDVFQNPDRVQARRFIIDDGKDVGYLLGTEVVNDIKVDGANRKWVATNTGVWLIAADGSAVVNHFTEQNSPLLSNQVHCIGIIDKTGEVFFGTDKGIVSFRGDATGGTNVHGKVIIFPNPVRETYKGPITISGLPENATVKITDISGKLVYEMVANGGTAIWDGNNFSGQRVQTGIYLFMTANNEDKDPHVTKLLLIN
ncbi:MAG: hypothetical protein H6607_09240 [Flavobacteriales bacterium]|nr:hypothetical protein [Flavobacteriales bacterium]